MFECPVAQEKPSLRNSLPSDPKFKYFLSDHLGSISLVLDNDSNAILQQQRYLPFGQPRTMPPYATVTSTDFTYTGQRVLPNTGLMDYKARFYSPALGRFIQPELQGKQGLLMRVIRILKKITCLIGIQGRFMRQSLLGAACT